MLLTNGRSLEYLEPLPQPRNKDESEEDDQDDADGALNQADPLFEYKTLPDTLPDVYNQVLSPPHRQRSPLSSAFNVVFLSFAFWVSISRGFHWCLGLLWCVGGQSGIYAWKGSGPVFRAQALKRWVPHGHQIVVITPR